MSNKTREYKRKYRACMVISILLLFLPVIIFTGVAFFKGTTTQKASLGIGLTLSAIFALANILFKFSPRSTVWILLISLTIALNQVSHVIYVTGSCVILEECIFSRLAKYYKSKFTINREIDERFEINEQEESKDGEEQRASNEG